MGKKIVKTKYRALMDHEVIKKGDLYAWKKQNGLPFDSEGYIDWRPAEKKDSYFLCRIGIKVGDCVNRVCEIPSHVKRKVTA